MSRSTRARLALVVLAVAAPFGLVFGGGEVGQCVGPLGVTAVQCATATGHVPGMGPGIAILSTGIAVVILLAWPVRRERLAAVAIAGGVAGAFAALGSLVLRERTMEGFDSTGAWLSIPRPPDPSIRVVLVVLAAVGAVLIVGRLAAADRS